MTVSSLLSSAALAESSALLKSSSTWACSPNRDEKQHSETSKMRNRIFIVAKLPILSILMSSLPWTQPHPLQSAVHREKYPLATNEYRCHGIYSGSCHSGSARSLRRLAPPIQHNLVH